MLSVEHNSLFNQQPQKEGQARQNLNETRWLSLDQIRKQQRCRRELVIAAMLSGQLPYERRGRIRYARVCDVQAWEQARLIKPKAEALAAIHPDLRKFL